jgi:hypothetical protein
MLRARGLQLVRRSLSPDQVFAHSAPTAYSPTRNVRALSWGRML